MSPCLRSVGCSLVSSALGVIISHGQGIEAEKIKKAHYNLGLMYFEKGFKDDARMEFEEALKLNPSDREVKQQLDRIDETQHR